MIGHVIGVTELIITALKLFLMFGLLKSWNDFGPFFMVTDSSWAIAMDWNERALRKATIEEYKDVWEKAGKIPYR